MNARPFLRNPNLKIVELKEGEHPHMLCTRAGMRFVCRLSYTCKLEIAGHYHMIPMYVLAVHVFTTVSYTINTPLLLSVK